MELINFSLASLAIVAAATIVSAAPSSDKPVSWEQYKNKDALKWALYSEHKGTNLQNAKPKYHECAVYLPRNKEYVFSHTFENNKDFEFQTVNGSVAGANCIDCLPTSLGNYYETRINAYIDCKMYENTPIDEGDDDA